MQKIFRTYTLLIITSASFLILIINAFFMSYSLTLQQRHTFNSKIEQILTILENNQKTANSINRNLGREYLTRAKTVAYVIEKNPAILEDTKELQQLADFLNIDELHIVNNKGILTHSSIPEYIGIDYHDNKQTEAFLFILESDKNAYLIQATQPNIQNNQMMKYIGVARQDQCGIIQIGISQTRMSQIQSADSYSDIFSTFPTDIGEEFFAIDLSTDNLLGHTQSEYTSDSALQVPVSRLMQCNRGSLVKADDNKFYYILSKKSDSVLLCASIPAGSLYKNFGINILLTFLCLLFIEAIILVMLNYLLDQKVIHGIHAILADLSHITNGNLDTVVAVGGNPEFEALSNGINTMVHSIFHSTDQITKIIDMSEIPLVVFEYQNETDHLFVTSGLKKMLHLSDTTTELLFKDPSQFYLRLQEIMTNPAEGEKDIYEIAENHFVRIHMTLEPSGYLGVITDVSADICRKQQMLYESTHDQLTGLFRYQYFKEHALQLLKDMPPGKICACVMLDLDYFKEINDTYGHDMGDTYLCHFASLLKMLPTKNCVVARRSGDEFCIFTFYHPGTDKIHQFVSDFWKSVKENPLDFPDQTKRSIGVSGGFAWTSHSDMDLDQLMSYADKALYEAKWNHKGTFIEYH